MGGRVLTGLIGLAITAAWSAVGCETILGLQEVQRIAVGGGGGLGGASGASAGTGGAAGAAGGGCIACLDAMTGGVASPAPCAPNYDELWTCIGNSCVAHQCCAPEASRDWAYWAQNLGVCGTNCSACITDHCRTQLLTCGFYVCPDGQSDAMCDVPCSVC
jgi:hypothetical protein